MRRGRGGVRAVAIAAAIGSGVIFGGGCGGAERTSTAPANMGRASVVVRWPESSRLIPFASNSIRVRLSSPDNLRELGSALLVRPAGGGNVTASFDRLAPGPVNVQASAYPNADGSGVVQASAQTTATVIDGQTAQVRLSLGSAVDRLVATPSGTLAVTVGNTTALAVSARNAAGDTVVVSPGTFAWSSNNTAVASVDPGVGVRGVAAGDAIITITETESGKSVAIAVRVAPPGPQLVYSNDFQGTIGPEWSLRSVRQDPLDSADRLLGGFVNAIVRLSLTGLPSHSKATVSFDLYVLNSWDGNGSPPIGSEIWSLAVANGGPTLIYTNFNNNSEQQSYPGTFPIDSYPARTGAIVSQFNPRYTVYRLSKTFDHSASILGLDFAASGLEDFAENESWAIDDIQVTVE